MGQVTNIETKLPAHLAGFAIENNDDLTSGVSQGFKILSYKGKSWQVVDGDQRSLVTNADDEPAASVELVIIKANPNISKTYYPNGYEEGSTERPICYSNDSVAPAPDSTEPQAKKCAICPHNQFGSKITDNGARGKACADFRRLAVAPVDDLENALLLRVPAASLKEMVAFADLLKKRKVPYQALVTKVGFDHTVAYPKLTFKVARWLDVAEVPVVQEMIDSDLVATITAMNAPTQAEAELDELGPAPAHVAQVAQVAQVAAEPAPAPAAKRGRPPKAAATPAEVAAAVEVVAAEAAPFVEDKPASTATVLVSGAMAELDAVLGVFDD